MDTTILTGIGLSEIQAKIYLYLIEHGKTVASKIAAGVGENRTTVYSALEKLEKLGIVVQKEKGKISAYSPSHPSVLETIAEKRLRGVAKQVHNLEGNLPSIINYYHEHQSEPGAATFYGEEGIKFVHEKALATKKPFYFIRSHHDKLDPNNHDMLRAFKKARAEAGISSEDITPSEFTKNTNKDTKKWLLNTRTLLPPGEYNSPIEIDIFGDNVAFINYEKNGMSTVIESPEIADAMRQFFLFSKKYIRKATDQSALDDEINKRNKSA